MKKTICTWKLPESQYFEVWETGCENSFFFGGDGTPKEHGFKFCPYCGLVLNEEEVED